MKRIFLSLLISIIGFDLSAQSLEENELRYSNAIDWLNSKLNYLYYDDVNEKWWNNTFYINENKLVTIKHISSSKPNTVDISDKTYVVRTFELADIDPKSLKISKIEQSNGRIVKGSMLELRTFGFQDLIRKTINRRKGSSTSYLFLSFPEVLNDSLDNYAYIVQEKFSEAILASTSMYASRDGSDENRIIEVLTGTFQTPGLYQWEAKPIYPNVLEIQHGNNERMYLGYEEDSKKFYMLDIAPKGTSTQYLKLKNDEKLVLQSDTTELLRIETAHSFIFKGEEYIRK